MYTSREIWLIRAALWILEMLLLAFPARSHLCYGASQARRKWHSGKKKHRLLDTGRQPKWMVWLLYTDICPVRNQDFSLRLNTSMWGIAFLCMLSEVLLGWLPITSVLRILLAICTVFLGVCALIGACMDYKRKYGYIVVLWRKENSCMNHYDSFIFDLVSLGTSFVIASCYFII